MGIEDIERHKYNFKLFCWFLKERRQYQFFKKIMFTNYNRTPNDLFKDINYADIDYIIFFKLDRGYNVIDRKWCSVFSYGPFCRFFWDGKKGEITNYENMIKLSNEWKEFLIEHNYDKKRQK